MRCVLTEAGAKFVTPLSLQALTEDKVYSDMFSLTDESEMGHIELSREADLLVVAPATANILARMAAGLADDLATTVLLATDKPVLAAPAMNVRMWSHAATAANVETLKKRGIHFVGPNDGVMACNEYGPGRMSEPEEIVAAIEVLLSTEKSPVEKPMAGKRALVTSGPTREAIDPVRYISNHSSGKQGHAIAAALAQLGAEVTLVSGPVSVPDPAGVTVVKIDSADQMLGGLPRRRAKSMSRSAPPPSPTGRWPSRRRRRSRRRQAPRRPPSSSRPTPTSWRRSSKPGPKRPALVVGFAAETENVVANAIEKRTRRAATGSSPTTSRPPRGPSAASATPCT